MTSPKIRATRHSAARCCGRIDLAPSRRVAALGFIWLTIACLTILLGVALPWPVRLALVFATAAANVQVLTSLVLLRGGRAVRSIEWNAAGQFRVRLGNTGTYCPVTLSPASFRLGLVFLVLWFATPAGSRAVLIDAAAQDRVAFRRLVRRLNQAPAAAAGLLPGGS